MFHKKRSNVWHKIKPLPRGLQNLSWVFFNSPFHVHFRNIQDFIIWWNLDRDNGKIVEGSHFINQYFSFITVARKWPLRIPQEHHDCTWALMTTHGNSGALRSAYAWSWVLMGPDDSSWGILIGHLLTTISKKKC